MIKWFHRVLVHHKKIVIDFFYNYIFFYAVSCTTSTCQENALLIRFSSACAAFCLIISLKKPKVMHQGFDVIPRVWENRKLTTQTKVTVYRAGILSALLYGSESWKTYAWQEKRLHTFHMTCLRCILSVHWNDKVSNSEVLERAGVFHFTPCSDKAGRGGWATFVEWRTDMVVFQRSSFTGELEHGSRLVGHPKLRYKNVCNRV